MKTSSLERFPGYVRLFFLGLGAALFLVARFAQAAPLSLADSPLFLTNTATPLVMLNISKDHQLYFKAYDDYSDINGDGRRTPLTTIPLIITAISIALNVITTIPSPPVSNLTHWRPIITATVIGAAIS